MLTVDQLQKKLSEVEALADEIRGKLAGLTPQERIAMLEKAQPMIKPKTMAMAMLLEAGYGMSIEQARKVISERDKNPVAWPLEEYSKANAMLAAYEAKAKPTSSRRA